MAISDVNKSVIQIVNEVQRKLGVTPTTTLSDTKLSQVLLDFVNDVIDELSDFGDWPQMFREAEVTALSSVGEYEITVSGNIKNVYEFVYDTQVAPLNVVTVEEIRRLQRVRMFGTPRHACVVEVSGVNAKFRVAPIPTNVSAGTTFDIALYKKPSLLQTADLSAIPNFPSRCLVQGVYAKSLLEESGGMPTGEYQTAYTEYLRMVKEARDRLTTDSGTDCYLLPRNRY